MFPRVIWMGTEPLKKKGRFRLVDRGPPREGRPDDARFALEQKLGFDSMKIPTWGPVKSPELAQWAMADILGQVLRFRYIRDLDVDHPLCCEINMAKIEGRTWSRGCDCDRPADPMRVE